MLTCQTRARVRSTCCPAAAQRRTSCASDDSRPSAAAPARRNHCKAGTVRRGKCGTPAWRQQTLRPMRPLPWHAHPEPRCSLRGHERRGAKTSQAAQQAQQADQRSGGRGGGGFCWQTCLRRSVQVSGTALCLCPTFARWWAAGNRIAACRARPRTPVNIRVLGFEWDAHRPPQRVPHHQRSTAIIGDGSQRSCTQFQTSVLNLSLVLHGRSPRLMSVLSRGPFKAQSELQLTSAVSISPGLV